MVSEQVPFIHMRYYLPLVEMSGKGNREESNMHTMWGKVGWSLLTRMDDVHRQDHELVKTTNLTLELAL